MFPLAIVCGNTFVLKPSERTPLSVCRLAELLREAALPDGVFNIVHGAKDAVNAACMPEGYFVGPTLFDHVRPGMTIWQDEIFAPVLSIVRARDFDEAIQIANQSPFANGACLFTNRADAIPKFRNEIDAGMLGINVGVPAPSDIVLYTSHGRPKAAALVSGPSR